MSLRNFAPLALAAVLLVVGLVAPARASVVTPMDVDELVRRSEVIVTGEVESIHSLRESGPERIDTYVTLRVTNALRGAAGLSHVTLKQPGGVWAGQLSVVFGTPVFERGEQVLVFATPTASGHLAVSGLFQGKYRLATDASGQTLATRDPGVGATLAGAPVAAPAAVPLSDLLARVRSPGAAAPLANDVPALMPVPPGGESLETTAQFTLLNPIIPLRWFEPDTAGDVSFSWNPAGAPGVPGGARAGFEAALQAWTDVTGSALSLSDGGDSGSVCFGFDGTSAVSHGDPCDQMPAFDSGTCSGVLAIGGVSWIALETTTLNGVSFIRIVESDVVLNAGIDCFMSIAGSYAEVVTHEIGHAVGLGHSCGDASSPDCATDPELDDAQMRAFAHGDGRGADPRADDVDGLRYLYPPAAFIDLEIDAAAYTTGETLDVTLEINGTATVDFYVFSIFPDGSFFYAGAATLNTIAPFSTSTPLGFYPNLTASATFTGAEPAGSYVLGVFVTIAGSDPLAPGSILAGDFATYTFTP